MSILGIFGRTADIVVVSVFFLQALLGIRVVRTLVQHIRHRREGMRRERELLALPLPPDEKLPAVLVQIPTYNEGMLIWRVLDAVVALDWPRDRLAVQVLDDSSGESAEQARAAVAASQAEGHNVTLLQRTDRAGFKAGALKLGLAATDQPFVVMFDADYVPSPDFLRKCMPPLLVQDDLAFVQARCDYLNAAQNWITRAQEIILDSHYVVEQPTRFWSGEVLPFNGTCGIWRRAAIEAAGGWHGDTLTEDLDLAATARSWIIGKRSIWSRSLCRASCRMRLRRGTGSSCAGTPVLPRRPASCCRGSLSAAVCHGAAGCGCAASRRLHIWDPDVDYRHRPTDRLRARHDHLADRPSADGAQSAGRPGEHFWLGFRQPNPAALAGRRTGNATMVAGRPDDLGDILDAGPFRGRDRARRGPRTFG